MTLHIQFISKQMVRLDITEMKNVGSCVEVSSSLVKHIHAQQFEDLRFKVIQKKIHSGNSRMATLYHEPKSDYLTSDEIPARLVNQTVVSWSGNMGWVFS